jgi:hypothetical protein
MQNAAAQRVLNVSQKQRPLGALMTVPNEHWPASVKRDRYAKTHMRRRTMFKNISTAVLFAIMGLFVTVLIGNRFMKPLPTKPTFAVITDVYPVQSRYSLRMGVTYRASDGLVGSSIYEAVDLHCRVGDTVQAFRTGMILRLAAGQC